MGKSTVSRPVGKPDKPYEGFPLFAHNTRRWAKKIRGKLHYFGPWGDPNGALERFNREWPYLCEGLTPPLIESGDVCTMRTLCNAFLTAKQSKLDAGDLGPRMFADYHSTCSGLVTFFGRERRIDDLRSDDFQSLRASMAKRLGPARLRNEITWIRSVFKFAFDERLIDRPVAYGQSFNRPSSKMLRRARNEAGPKLFTADEIHAILNAAPQQMRAMTLLGVNCGFGNTDVASLPESAVNLDAGWIDFPRPKTEIRRRCPLWPKTVEALRKSLATRPVRLNAEGKGLVFLTAQGRPWVRTKQAKTDDMATKPQVPIDALSQRFGKLLKALKINGRRRVGFYTLRHVFETVAGESKDQIAVDAIMGHVDPSMAAAYRESISDARLQAVVNVVHTWLYGDQVKPKTSKPRRRAKAKPAAKRVTKPKPSGEQFALRVFAG